MRDEIGMPPRGFATADSRAAFGDACVAGDLGAVKLLLDGGTDPDQRDGSFPALFCAAEHGQLAVVEELLARGADVKKRCSKPKPTRIRYNDETGEEEEEEEEEEPEEDPERLAALWCAHRAGVPLHIAAHKGHAAIAAALRAAPP